MSVLKEPLATPSRFRGIYRYLLKAKGQREKRETLEQLLSPHELVKSASSPRPMINENLKQMCKSGLLKSEGEEIYINPGLPEDARHPELGDSLLPNTLATLLFASDQTDEDFGRVCAWFLAQDIYECPGNWEVIERQVTYQGVGELLKMTSNTLFGQLDDWMCYMGLTWGHALDGKRVTVPDPSLYIKRNLKDLFQEQIGTKLPIQEFISQLANKCPLFETGQFREEIEANIGYRQTNYLSTSTAFALFRLQDEGYIQLKRESDAGLMILPKVNNQVDDDGRISHIIWQEEAV